MIRDSEICEKRGPGESTMFMKKCSILVVCANEFILIFLSLHVVNVKANFSNLKHGLT